jgi:uncharacterized Fe-S center protein
MDMSELAWVDNQGMLFDNTVAHKIRRLAEATEATRHCSEGMRVALKVNAAEDGYVYGLRPGFIRVLSDLAKEATQQRPVVCDGQRLADYWKRTRGNAFKEVASLAGYDGETLHGHFTINGGFSGDEGELFPCGVNSELGGVEVGTAVCRCDALWVLSHVTLHPLFGMSGALFNGGFDCLSGRARTRVLEGLNPYPFNGQQAASEERKAFRNRALETHCAVRTAMEGRVYYINYIWDVTPQPEYYPFSETPIIENLGFAASHDPVALDAATYALIREHAPEAAWFEDMAFEEILELAEGLGLGSLGKRPEHLS